MHGNVNKITDELNMCITQLKYYQSKCSSISYILYKYKLINEYILLKKECIFILIQFRKYTGNLF